MSSLTKKKGLGLLLFIALSLASFKWGTAINFIQGSFDQITEKAQSADKPFFVYFYGDSCPACQVMEKTTFQDAALVQLANEHFIAAKVDIYQKKQAGWKHNFNITSLPTLIIFDKNGQIKNRYKATITGSKLRHVLQENLNESETPAQDTKIIASVVIPKQEQALATPNQQSSNMPSSYTTDRASKQKVASAQLAKSPAQRSATYDTDKNDPKIIKLRLRVAKKETAIPAPSAPAKVVAKTVKKKTPKYVVQKGSIMEIQAGYFSQKANADKLVRRLQDRFDNIQVNIIHDHERPKTMYRVVIGPFMSKTKANALISSMRRSGFKGFVI